MYVVLDFLQPRKALHLLCPRLGDGWWCAVLDLPATTASCLDGPNNLVRFDIVVRDLTEDYVLAIEP